MNPADRSGLSRLFQKLVVGKRSVNGGWGLTAGINV
jgi:hypothetical protein